VKKHLPSTVRHPSIIVKPAVSARSARTLQSKSIHRQCDTLTFHLVLLCSTVDSSCTRQSLLSPSFIATTLCSVHDRQPLIPRLYIRSAQFTIGASTKTKHSLLLLTDAPRHWISASLTASVITPVLVPIVEGINREIKRTAFTARNNATHTGATPPMNLHPFLKSPSPSLRCRISADVRRNPRDCWTYIPLRPDRIPQFSPISIHKLLVCLLP